MRIVQFLSNIHTQPHSIYLSRHGQVSARAPPWAGHGVLAGCRCDDAPDAPRRQSSAPRFQRQRHRSRGDAKRSIEDVGRSSRVQHSAQCSMLRLRCGLESRSLRLLRARCAPRRTLARTATLGCSEDAEDENEGRRADERLASGRLSSARLRALVAFALASVPPALTAARAALLVWRGWRGLERVQRSGQARRQPAAHHPW